MSPRSRVRWTVAAMALIACSPTDREPRFRPAGSTTPRNGGTLRFAVQDHVSTLDPTIGYDEFSYYILHALFDTLVDYSPSLEIIPRLARRWEISPDGLVYTFELRSDITYASDGASITAAHFKYSLERALAAPDSPFSPYLSDIVGAKEAIEQAQTAMKEAKEHEQDQDVIGRNPPACAGIIVDGDHRLVIRLLRINPALLDILAMPFATPQRREHVAAEGDQLRRRPDATGPFKLVSWSEGERIELVRYQHYYDLTRVHLDRIVMLENIQRDTQFQMFERAELDTAEKLAAPDYLFVMSEPAWQPYVHRSVTMNAFGSRMNVQMKPFDDRRVRQALNYALDKNHTARLLNGTTVPAHGILPPGMHGRDPDLAPYPHDIAKARTLLAEAGHPDGFDVEYLTTNDEETLRIAASLQSDLAEIGVRVHIAVVSFATWHTETSQQQGPAFSFGNWTADFPDPINFFEPRFHSRSIKDTDSTNDSFYRNHELDKLLDDAHQELDSSKREALYRRAERILYDDAPWIWDYHRVSVEVTQPFVAGYEPHPIWMRDYTSAWLDVGPDGSPVLR